MKLIAALVFAGALALPACQSPPGGASPAAEAPRAATLSPILQRMKSAYPDLAEGRFVSVADFESPGQVGLFRVVGADGQPGDRAQPTLSILKCRNETGAGSLKCRLDSPADTLRCDGVNSPQLALTRDWRPYALLLMSIYGPDGGATLEFAAVSGVDTPLRWSQTIAVRPGWNLVRVDVATIDDAIDLADVRRLEWRVKDASGPTELYLDDVILADNTQYRLGQNARAGEMYVYNRGTRLHVGARDRFELAFSVGQIVRWTDAAGENLADGAGLGPWPTPLPADWAERKDLALDYDSPAVFADWGSSVATSQRLVEATPMRVVVEGRWRFVDRGAGDDVESRPGHTWRYVIYNHGAVDVHVTSRAGDAGWPTARIGYVVALDGRRGFKTTTSSGASERSAAFVLAARQGASKADLLWTWSQRDTLPTQRELVSLDERRLALVAGAVDAADTVEAVHLLRVWPADIDTIAEARSFATDFQQPVAIHALTGRLLTNAPGDLNADGFNESEGCYELALDERLLRFDFDPAELPRFDATFRVHGVEDHQCWVYARGKQITDVGRDGENRLLFRLPRVTNPAGIEVHAAGPERP